MLKVKRFINELMTSNCYVVYDEYTKRCLVIDPGSEKSSSEIEFIADNQFQLDYIIISHEHTDHNWGVNALRKVYQLSKLICSEICNNNVKKTNKKYFLLYYNNPDYQYEIASADFLISKDTDSIVWNDHLVRFILTPGHSNGSICIGIDNMLFTGDTIMPYKPHFNGRDSNEKDWYSSVSKVESLYPADTIVFPGHGEILTLGEWKETSKIV